MVLLEHSVFKVYVFLTKLEKDLFGLYIWFRAFYPLQEKWIK